MKNWDELILLLYQITSQLILHELLHLGSILRVNRSLRVVRTAVLKHEVAIGNESLQIVILIGV